MLDNMVLGALCVLIGWLTGAPKWYEAHATTAVILCWLYFAGMESSHWQATLGKKAFSLRVTDLQGRRISFLRATGRHLAKLLSFLTLFLGFLMIPFTKRKQALHDMIARCVVVWS